MAAYTEAEAATKWCPLTRTAHFTHQTGGYNRMDQGPAGQTDTETALNTRCLGSNCMLWNWQDTAHRLNEDGLRRIRDGQFPGPDSSEPNPHRRGFCGLTRSV